MEETEATVMAFQKVGIIGLGLIGGSIALRLKQKGYTLYSLKSKSPDLKKAKKVLTKVYSDIDALANASDLLIIATPLSSILPIARTIHVKKKLLVIDVGSVKAMIAKEFETLSTGPVEFLATHPIAGTEKQGFESANPNLFEGAFWAIVPHKKNRAKIKQWIRLFGAKPIVLTAKEHDKKMALISHLPALISEALLTFAQKKDPESLKLSGPGFRSMTRLARGNRQLLDEMKALNQKNLRPLYKEWLQFLKDN